MQFPSRVTPPLVEDPDNPGWPLYTDGPRLIQFLALVNPSITYDRWQIYFLHCVLELFPPGHPLEGQLRFRQGVLSVARRNGKTEIVSALGLYLYFLHKNAPEVIAAARNREQAAILYDRVFHIIQGSKHLLHKVKPSRTRGLKYRSGPGTFRTVPSNSDSLQGFGGSFLLDEVHVVKPDVYGALVDGQGAEAHVLGVGLTTAGDDTSELLIDLYKRADKAIANPESDVRFGAWIWEGPPGSTVADHDAVMAANPAIAEGRISIENRLSDVRDKPDHEIQRYLFNRFVANENPYVAPDVWNKFKRSPSPLADLNGSYVCIDKSPSFGAASVVAAKKREDGTIKVDLIASLVSPDIDDLKTLCSSLTFKPTAFVIDTYGLKELANFLESKGHRVIRTGQAEAYRAAGQVYSLISKGRVTHDGNALFSEHFSNAVTKQSGDAYRIVRQTAKSDIDACVGAVMSIFAAENADAAPKQEILVAKRSA